MNETEAWLTLNAAPGVGNATIRDLVQYYGSAQKVFTLTKPELMSCGLSEAVAAKIFEFDRDKFLKSEYNLIQQNGVEVITRKDPDYPELLKEIPDVPAVLYIKGNRAFLKNTAIAMVGSRQASVYGLSVAEKFARQLAEYGITIISGLARGIDTASHRGCLLGGGTTVAVVGCGLAQIYPPENKGMFEQIVEKGVIISEFPMQMPPLAQNFPRRNRIISGLSLGVIVVEAALKSGALVTASMALEQGREVFAIPGSIDRPNAQGVNALIKQGAKLTSSVADILEELAPALRQSLKKVELPVQEPSVDSPSIGLTPEEQNIFAHISHQPIHADELLESPNALSVLLHLELKHLIKQLPGKRFVRI